MQTLFEAYAPSYYFPLSGSVTQRIDPQVVFGNIQGVPEVEHRVVTEVASFGKQLGKILEALDVLSKATGTPLPEIARLKAEIEAVKVDCRRALERDAEDALARLKEIAPERYARVLRRQG